MRNEQLDVLERQLRSLSHSEEAIQAVESFSKRLGTTRARLGLFNTTDALVRRAIEPEEAAALGFNSPEDRFVLLQGDIVTTNSAYFLGERVTGEPLYAVLNASCDLVPNRKAFAALLRISRIKRHDQSAKEALGTLLKFSRRDSMYLPVLPTDGEDVIANVIQFDGVCQIASDHLMLATRIASLSLVGWRIFASMVRVVFSRANPREADLREKIETATVP